MAGTINHRKTFFLRLGAPFQSKPNRFFVRLSEQAGLTHSGLQALLKYMIAPSPEAAQQLHDVEKSADESRRILIEEINRTFATPIDREDIFSLSRAIDDILDYADSTVIEMDLLSVQPNNYLRLMTELLRDSAEEIQLAVERLQHHPAVANEHAMKAKAIENRIENIYRRAIADLFRGPKNAAELIDMLKMREVYRHMSNAADRGDEAANILSDIVVKMT